MDDTRKYEFTGETKEVITSEGRKATLHQIRALRDVASFKEGSIGGWIEKESNLSHKGDCWVTGNACVYDDAEVTDDVKVCNQAQICGNAKLHNRVEVFGKVRIFDSAELYDNVWVSGTSEIYENATIHGDVQIKGSCRIYGKAYIGGKVFVRDNVRISGKVYIEGDIYIGENAVISGNVRILHKAYICGYADIFKQSHIMIAGPFGNNEEELATFFRVHTLYPHPKSSVVVAYCNRLYNLQDFIERVRMMNEAIYENENSDIEDTYSYIDEDENFSVFDELVRSI